MKKSTFLCCLFFVALFSRAQQKPVLYTVTKEMIPMRDGVRLYTVICKPVGNDEPMPILMTRTPYGAGRSFPKEGSIDLSDYRYGREKYILVYQDIRGKNNSEGQFRMHRPVNVPVRDGAVDESTDTYDTIDWLIKNVKDNNGKVGIHGISYPGFLTLTGSVHAHPALKAISPQAAMGDLFLGDDFHHNGAFRLSYGFEYSYRMETEKDNSQYFPFKQFDLYDWYLRLGSLKNVNEKYFKGKVPTWNNFIKHPSYDTFWQYDSPLRYLKTAEVPTLHIGGYYDQEDITGPQLIYEQMEKSDPKKWNHLVLGPWYHGQWEGKADSIGRIAFTVNTADFYKDLELRWFNYYLKGIGDGNFDEVYAFQTGSNQWKSYATWPPKAVTVKNLYLQPDKSLSFNKPVSAKGTVEYISDPAHPVPYRSLPIQATYGPKSRWRTWQVEDQRFVYNRPDVACFVMDSLTEDLTVTGKVIAHLVAATTGTDADWIVKLIDVYPDTDPVDLEMSQYQLPVAMEVFRGRFRKSFSYPLPMVPGKAEAINIDLHIINHTFKKGHRIMVQVQSSWFPVIDRNPQKFIPNIFEAAESDFITTTQSIRCNSIEDSYIELPVQ